MPGRVGQVTGNPVGYTPPRKGRRKKPPKVSVPYAPTRKGKEAEEKARGHVTVPYAPTPAGKAAEHSARRERKAAARAAAQQSARKARRQSARKARRIESKALKTLPGAEVPVPRTVKQADVIRKARTSNDLPSAKWRKANPKAAKRVDEAHFKYITEHENLGEPEDITHAIEIAGLATGLGGAVKGAIKAGEIGGEALLAKDAVSGAASAAGSAGSKVAKVAREAKGGLKARAGAKVERIRTTPERIKTAPGRAKTAASTKAGRRAATKGAARKARRHPVRTGYAAAVSPVPLPGELDKRARAFAKGTAAATLNHPGKVLETTGQGVLGFLTAPLAVGGAAVQSVKEGSPAPLGHEVKTLGEGTARMVSNLASGNAKKVEQTTLQETGLVPFIPVPHVLRRLSGMRAYEDTRGALRGKVEARRAGTREKRVAAEKTATESGDFIPKRKARKVRQPVADTTKPGENYVLRRTGKLIEKQRSRHRVAREVTRMEEEGALAGKRESEAVAKPLRKSPGTNQKAQNDGEALRIFVNHGLPHDEKAAMPLIEMLHERWPEIKHGDVPPGVHLDRHSTKFIIDHPEIFRGKRGKQFFASVREFERQSNAVGTSERNRYLAQVNNVINPIRAKEGKAPILKPEEMVTPEMHSILPKRDREWNRSEALSYAADLWKVKGADRAKALDQRKALLHAFENAEGPGKGLMRPPDHRGPEHGVSTTGAVAWTPEMEQRMVNQVLPEIKRLGLRKPAAYVADVVPSGLKGEDKAPNFAAELPVRKVWPSQGKASVSGNALSDFESTIYHSIEAPRARAAAVRGLNRIFDHASRKVMGKRYLTLREVEKAIATRQVPDGTIFLRTQALRSVLEGDHVVNPEEFRRTLMGEVEHGQMLASKDQLAGEIQAMKEGGVKGDKFAPMDAASIHELLGHMEPLGGVTLGMGHATNFVTRSILNSPAFEAAQFAQEGLPMAAALGRNVVNAPKAIAALKDVAKLPAEQQAAIRSVVGSSAGLLGAPKLKALRSEGFMNPIRAAGSKQAWRHAWEVVNGDKLSRFDRARAGRFREVGAMAKIEGDFRRAEKGFGLWRSSANNLFRHEQEAVDAMRGMNAAERASYVAEHPRLGDKLMQDMQGLMGNWNSFTVFEKQIAPFAIFYPFQRYSVLWMLYHFPLDHPVVATGLAMLGEVNAQELKKIAAKEGATPSVLDYTKPVINGETVLPAGQRFFPGLASIQQAALEGKPTQALSTLSPALSIPIEALGGKNAYTGAPLGENGWVYALRQLGNLSPFLRFIGAPDIGKGKSPGSEAFGVLDPLRTQRSVFDPYIGQTAKQFSKERKLSQDFSRKYGEGHVPDAFDSKLVQELLYGGPHDTPQPHLLPRVLEAIHASERGAAAVKRAEKPFLPKSKPFSDKQKELLQAVEDAWKTGPNAQPEEENQFGIPSQSPSELRKQFGLPDTSASKLREEFGIE